MMNDTNFDTPDAHFDKLCLFSDAQAEKLKLRNESDYPKEKKYSVHTCLPSRRRSTTNFRYEKCAHNPLGSPGPQLIARAFIVDA
jgi:hypothetical protein